MAATRAEKESAGAERLRAEALFHQQLRDLTVAFARSVSSVFGFEAALQALVLDINALLGARRTSLWLYDRRVDRLVPAACSDASQPPPAGGVQSDDLEAAPAAGLRLDYPRLLVASDDALLVAPLRGWRRALGTLVAEEPAQPLGTDHLLALTHELTRQVSAGLENIQLIQEILRQRRLLEGTFDSLVDLVVVTDAGGRIVHVNDSFCSRIGLSRTELLERRLDSLVGDRLAAWLAEWNHREDQMDGPRMEKLEDGRLGGTFAVTTTPLVPGPGTPAGLVVLIRDITHQTRLESEREGLRDRLAQSERLASLGQFVAGIAHEMNNPLQGVLGHLELLMETSPAARPIRRELRRIHQDADRAARIVRSLTLFTGSPRLSRRRLRLTRIISRVLTSRAAALRRAGIDVSRDEAPDLPFVSGDALLIHQALLNVVINAEHAMEAGDHGGRLAIRTATDAARTRVTVAVKDSGPGISPDVLPHVFDPFYTTKEVGRGTGLGLAITYGIVQDHGGSIRAENAPDGGALFTIELPAAAG